MRQRCRRAFLAQTGGFVVHFELCRRFGVRVVEVEGLRDDVVYVDGHDIALVRSDLDQEGRRWAAGWVLGEALADRIVL